MAGKWVGGGKALRQALLQLHGGKAASVPFPYELTAL